jgi:hypothetical protein
MNDLEEEKKDQKTDIIEETVRIMEGMKKLGYDVLGIEYTSHCTLSLKVILSNYNMGIGPN